MERAVDKCILYICVAYTLWQSLGGAYRIVSVYLTMAFFAATLWLIPTCSGSSLLKLKDGSPRLILVWILMDLLAVFILFQPVLLGLLPLLVYDMIYSRHLPGLILCAAAYLNGLLFQLPKEHVDTWIFLVITASLLLSVWLSFKTIRLTLAKKQIRSLRDDSEEQARKLNRQNEQLMEARDGEVITAQLAERNRIAREIHDNVGHTLSRALLQVGALLAIHKEEPVHSELSEVRRSLDGAMNHIRASVHDLHDSSVNLEETVRQVTEPLSEDFHLTLDIDVSRELPRDIKYGIIGILREAVSNILRHSRNDTVQIGILEHPAFCQLVVHDYLSEGGTLRSRPVTGTESGSPGIGLTNMESRARALGGTVRITEDRGYRVFVSIPK